MLKTTFRQGGTMPRDQGWRFRVPCTFALGSSQANVSREAFYHHLRIRCLLWLFGAPVALCPDP